MNDDETRERDREAEAARARAAIRPPRKRRCALCGVTALLASNGRYCSDNCRQRAYRERKQARTPLTLAREIAEALDARRYARARHLCDTLTTSLEKSQACN